MPAKLYLPGLTADQRTQLAVLPNRGRHPARQSTIFPEVRPGLADDGYCGDWLASLCGKSSGTLWYALWRSKKAASEGEPAHRA
jgi:hypothetical protein